MTRRSIGSSVAVGDDEAPTPRVSHADSLVDACSVLAARLDALALRKRKRVTELDIEGAYQCQKLAERAIRLAGLFAGWSLNPERAATERQTLGEDLRKLVEEARGFLEGSGL